MDMTLGWLHISDLHFLAKKDWQNNPVLKAMLTDVKELFDEGRRIDVIFCTGDIGFGETDAEPLARQYETAKVFFDELLRICNLPSERLFLVPGNHDIDRKQVAESQTEFFRNKDRRCADINQRFRDGDREVRNAMQRLGQYKDFVAANFPHILLNDNVNFGTTIDVNGLLLSISGFNSAWTCADDKDKGQIWLAGEAQLAACATALAVTQGTNKPHLRIALIHHPLDAFRSDETIGSNGKIESHFEFLLHGHAHDQWVRETPHPHHIVIAAGAATAATSEEFGYNLAQFAPGTAEIHLRRYTQKGGGGWIAENIPSRTKHGVWPLTKPPACFNKSALPTAHASPEPASAAPVAVHGSTSTVPTGAVARGHYGIDDILAQCTAQLRKSPLLALCGMAGVGKTVIVSELRELAQWRDLRRIGFTAHNSSSVDDVFSALASLLDIRDERPRAPTGENVTKMVSRLRTICANPPAFFLHIERGQLWFNGGQWRPESKPIADLLAALVGAYPGSVVVLETRETPDAMDFFEAKGLSKAAMVQYLAQPPDLPGAGWALQANQCTYIFQRMGGGHGRGAHAYGLMLLTQLAASKAISPEKILREHADTLTDELYARLFRDIYENVLEPAERSLLFACSLYRAGLHYSHLQRLETALPAARASAALIRRRLLTEDNEWFYLHDLAAEQAHKLEMDAAQVPAIHRHIAGFWLADLLGQNAPLEPNIKRALEALYHLEQGGEGYRVTEIAAELLGRRPGDAAAMLWRIEEEYIRQNNLENVCLILDYLLKVAPEDHKAMRFLGESRRKLYGKTDARALALFRAAVSCDPGFPHYWANFGHAAMACGAEALQAFLTEIMTAPPGAINDQVTAIYAGALQAAGRVEEASQLRRAKIDARSANAVFYNDEAQWLLDQQHNGAGALTVLELARKNGCSNEFTEAIYASALQATGRGGEASQLRRAMIDADSAHAAFYNDEAKWLLDQWHDGAGALAMLELARKNGCSDEFTEAIYASILQATGRGREASRLRQAKIDSGSRHAAFYADEAKWLLDQQHDGAGALTVLKLARRNGCSNEVTEAIYASVLQATGRGGEA